MPGDDVVTPFGLQRLRLAAALGHGLPGVRIRVRDGGRLLVHAAWDLDPRCDLDGTHHLRPCGFRHAVAVAWDALRRGSRAEVSLPLGAEPDVELLLDHGHATHPGGICATRCGARRVQVFATTLDAERAAAVIESIDEEALGPDGADLPFTDTPLTVMLRPDPLVDVTLVWAEDTFDDPVRRGALDLVLRAAQQRCAAAELDDDLAVMFAGPATDRR
ncbi:MAG: hypothetical protein S0880_07510 [Actinomycetota bacterium]|nr:hypothetical protein [Actinomycetota bacterium]